MQLVSYLINVTNDNAKRDGTDNLEMLINRWICSSTQRKNIFATTPRLLVFKNVCDCILDKSSALIRAQIA